MKILNWNDLLSSEKKTALKRPLSQSEDQQLSNSVKRIIERVQKEGDDALKSLSKEFDKVKLDQFHILAEDLSSAWDNLEEDGKKAINQAYENLYQFHQLQIPKEVELKSESGISLKKKFVSLNRVGLYVPGGSAPLFSSVLMMAISANLAGVENIILCTPPSTQGVHPLILASAYRCGIDKVFQIGGAQAIAAMAYGTESIPKVDKIFGPGNSFVARAKQLVAQDPLGADLDMPAGPSEVMVVADKLADPNFLALDLLSQAEHGPDSQVIAIVESESQAISLKETYENWTKKLNRESILKTSQKHTRFIICSDEKEILRIINSYAPEHLIINTNNPEQIGDQVINAGSIFLGAWSPESAGDYASGTNHVLPTSGYAKTYSGLGPVHFMKSITIQKLSKEGLQSIADTVMWMADKEGLEAHKMAVLYRVKDLP